MRPGERNFSWVGPPVCAPGCSVHADCVATGFCDLQSGRCGPPREICDDLAAVDEDLQNGANEDDPSCWGTFYPYPNEVNCTDGIDNDDDGPVDCADSECAWFWRCAEDAEVCDDTTDNDGDTFVDCADTDCLYSDPDCGAVWLDDESMCPDGDCCGNSYDDDTDGFMDCADEDCALLGLATGDCLAQELACFDFNDDEGDGYVDCFDSECVCTPGATGPGGMCDMHTDCAVDPSTPTATPFCVPGGFFASASTCTQGCNLASNNCPLYSVCVDLLLAPDQGVCMRPCLSNDWCDEPGAICDVPPGGSVFEMIWGIPVGACVAGCQTMGCDGTLVCDEDTGLCGEGGALCSNGIDDDGDGLRDCLQPTCSADPFCTERGEGEFGDPCTSAEDCEGAPTGALCLDEESSHSPGGYCSAWCEFLTDDCGEGAARATNEATAAIP
jgi:hypothetical protein